MFAVPAHAALALAVAAGPVLCAARVAGSLVTRCPHPAILAATGAPDADTVAAAVRGTDLCGQGKEVGSKRWGRRENTRFEQVLVRSKGHTLATYQASVSGWDSRSLGD